MGAAQGAATPGLMCALACVIAYLLCGIPSGLIIGRWLGHTDVRAAGSGNIGTTNVARTAGKGAAALTLACDVLKAFVGVLVGYALVGLVGAGDVSAVRPGASLDWMMGLVYLACVLGHIFSPYLRFKGGKGIAVGFGGALALDAPFGLSLWIPFLALALTTRRVSAGSIAAAATLPLLAWLTMRPTGPFLAIMVALAAIVVWSHRANIRRLARGEEKPFSFGHSGDAKGGERAS